MAFASLFFLLMISSSLHVGQSVDTLITLECQPVVGVIGQTTNIVCKIFSRAESVPTINTVVIFKHGANESCFTFNKYDKVVKGDDRFLHEHAPSLQLKNTMISDEGVYNYFIRTNLGNDRITFTINVTAKYHEPVISSEQEMLVSGGAADLNCKANGGYPAGTIHWFDGSKTNWTENAVLQVTRGSDGLCSLSSELSFKSFDPIWGDFQCIVLNSKYQEEGHSISNLKIIGTEDENGDKGNDSMMKNIVAAAVVIGSLVVGLLIALLFKRRRVQQLRRASATPILRHNESEPVYSDEENDLCEADQNTEA